MKELSRIASELEAVLAMNRRPGITEDNQFDVQALCVAEEAGELVGAYRRYSGKARRIGHLADVAEEIADVLIVTAVFAYQLGVDIESAVRDKLAVIYSRGWQET